MGSNLYKPLFFPSPMHKKEVRRRKNLRHRIKAFFLVGFLVVFSAVLALVLFSEQLSLQGYTVAESSSLQQAKVEKQTTILYLLGATVLVLLSAYCFLLYKKYI